MSVQTTWGLVILVGAFPATLIGIWRYRSFAVRRGIVAKPNFRSLHELPIPSGGGLVFSAVCLCGAAGLWGAGIVAPRVALALVAGGAAATIVGFVDDAVQIRALWKLLAQAILAAWVLLCFDARPVIDLPSVPIVVELAVSWLGLVWLMNVYNFMDGVDGMAATGAILMSVSAIGVITVARVAGRLVPTDDGLVLLFAVLALCNLGFLVFNRPPASIFMGDSGSLFLGLAFSALIVATVVDGQIAAWTWLIIFGYFAGDTTTTSIVRIFVSQKWYGEHRSHAYQNLARMSGSHSRVVLGVSLYHFAWLLPLAMWSTLQPSTAPLAAALALVPVVVWTLRHGPLLSSS